MPPEAAPQQPSLEQLARQIRQTEHQHGRIELAVEVATLIVTQRGNGISAEATLHHVLETLDAEAQKATKPIRSVA